MNYKLTNSRTLKTLLAREGFRPRRSAGQHFLVCPEVVETNLLALAGAPRQATELGSGVGTLTQALVAAGFAVKAVERDVQLARVLQVVIPRAQRSRLELVIHDLRDVSWEWQVPYCLVGNIPYNLSGFIIRRLVQLDPAPERAVLLVQKEVGERVKTGAPHMSLLGLTVHLWGEVTMLLKVPRSCFWPQPRVDSQLLLVVPHHHYTVEEREEIIALARRFFQAKRKQIGGTLARILEISPTRVARHLHELGLRPAQRPQELALEQWRALVLSLPAVR